MIDICTMMTPDFYIYQMFTTRRNKVFLVLAGIFITNAITAELIGGKLIDVGPYVMSVGILPWPIVFLTTDLVNEYYGKDQVKRLSVMTAALIAYCFLLLLMSIGIPASTQASGITDSQFNAVFGQSLWIIVGSIAAFLVSQLIDAVIFQYVKRRTGQKWIWLRSTGSTVISQFFDSFIVLGIAFYLTGKMDFDMYVASGLTGYGVKLAIAVALTPLIYIGHGIIDKYLEKDGK